MDNSAIKEDKFALITGATGGIGRAIANALVNEGYTLILHGRSQKKLDELLSELPKKHHSIAADISEISECNILIDKAFNIGRVTLLVNNAGVSHFGSVTSKDYSDEDIATLMQINLIAPIQLTKYFINKVKNKQQATVINIGSALGSIGFPGFSLYCASKFGLRGFSETLSRELTATNIRVAYLGPRTTNTEINSSQVTNMNNALNTSVDTTEYVAKEFITLLNTTKHRKIVGWPEKLFARINGVIPELVDNAFINKTKKIKQFFK